MYKDYYINYLHPISFYGTFERKRWAAHKQTASYLKSKHKAIAVTVEFCVSSEVRTSSTYKK
jgi:hypothetical protein